MPIKKKVDNSWNLINFYKNSTSASKSHVSIDMISDNGNFDDILSNTSSDESDLPLDPPKECVTEFSFDTLTPKDKDEESDSDELLVVNPPKIGGDGWHIKLINFFAQTLINLKTWQIILLTSSSTLFVTYLTQSFLQAEINSSDGGLSTIPYFTQHGAVYKNIELVVPFGEEISTSKYFVDFENRVAYPVTSEVSFWETQKFQLVEQLEPLWKQIRQLGSNFHFQSLKQFAIAKYQDSADLLGAVREKYGAKFNGNYIASLQRAFDNGRRRILLSTKSARNLTKKSYNEVRAKIITILDDGVPNVIGKSKLEVKRLGKFKASFIKRWYKRKPVYAFKLKQLLHRSSKQWRKTLAMLKFRNKGST